MGQCVSPAYYPEAVEEECRVKTVRRYCLPERWFVPRPVERNTRLVGRGKKKHLVIRERPLRRGADCHPLQKKRPGLRFFPVRETPAVADPTDAIVELLDLNPSYALEVYEQAAETGNQKVLAALLTAMSRIGTETRKILRTHIVIRFPDNRFRNHLRAALA